MSIKVKVKSQTFNQGFEFTLQKNKSVRFSKNFNLKIQDIEEKITVKKPDPKLFPTSKEFWRKNLA